MIMKTRTLFLLVLLLALCTTLAAEDPRVPEVGPEVPRPPGGESSRTTGKTCNGEGKNDKRRVTVWGFFRPTKEEFFADEPITVEMVVHNDSAEDLRFDTGGDYRHGNGRQDRFFVTFGDPKVKYLSAGGGLLGSAVVRAKGVYKEVIDLTPWSPPAPDEKGIIRVTCRRTLTSHVDTKLLVHCLEKQPLDYARKDARAALIAEMTRLNQHRAGFADDREKQKEIERVVDLYMRFPQIQSTVECKVSGRLKDTSENKQDQAPDTEGIQGSSQVVNELRIDLTAKVMPDGQPKLRIRFTNVAWDPFDVIACPLFLEVQDQRGHWRTFQHPRWGSNKREGTQTFELGAGTSETEPISAFTFLPPGRHLVRVSIAIDQGMASKYESTRIWTGVARSNCVVVEIPPPDSEDGQPDKET